LHNTLHGGEIIGHCGSVGGGLKNDGLICQGHAALRANRRLIGFGPPFLFSLAVRTTHLANSC
jgi:hypothetical protein